MLLQQSGKEICDTLLMLCNSRNHGILFHCTHGKDRTGLIAALVLAAIGVPEDDIIRDYTASDEQGFLFINFLFCFFNLFFLTFFFCDFLLRPPSPPPLLPQPPNLFKPGGCEKVYNHPPHPTPQLLPPPL